MEAALAYGEHEPRVRARLLAALASELRGTSEHERIAGLASEAIQIARQVGDPWLSAQVYNLVVFALWLPGTIEERLELTDHAVSCARTVGNGALLHWSLFWRVHALVESGAVEAAATCLEEMTHIAERLSPALAWTSGASGRHFAILRGDVHAAEAAHLQPGVASRSRRRMMTSTTMSSSLAQRSPGTWATRRE